MLAVESAGYFLRSAGVDRAVRGALPASVAIHVKLCERHDVAKGKTVTFDLRAL